MEKTTNLTWKDYLGIAGGGLISLIAIPLVVLGGTITGSYLMYKASYGSRIRTRSILPRTKKSKIEFYESELSCANRRYDTMNRVLDNSEGMRVLAHSQGMNDIDKYFDKRKSEIIYFTSNLDNKRKILKSKLENLMASLNILSS